MSRVRLGGNYVSMALGVAYLVFVYPMPWQNMVQDVLW